MGLFPGAIQPGQPNPYTLLFQFDLTDINTWFHSRLLIIGMFYVTSSLRFTNLYQ
jgi:hypothetical protein